jgi:CMP-N-acetylneuraminic acid synthetase
MGNIISIIPARAGSKGIPSKNIRLLNGEPLIVYSIKASLNTELISRTIVSTDSEEIAEIAKKHGSEVPFLRPKAISGDKSTDYDFFLHTINWFEKNEDYIPEYFVHLRPTTPLRDPSVINRAIELFINNKSATSLRSVHEMSESAYKCFEVEDNKLKMIVTGSFELDRANDPRQGFPTTFYANGYVDIIKSRFVIENKKIHGNCVLPFITDIVVEVDTLEDLIFLEYQLTHTKR